MKKIFVTFVALMVSVSAFAREYTTVIYEQPGPITCAFGIVASACHLVGSILEPKTYVTTQYSCATAVPPVPTTPAIPAVNTVGVVPTAIVGTPVANTAVTVPATTQVVSVATPVATATAVAPPIVHIKSYSWLTPDYTVINGILYRLYYSYRNGRCEYYYKPVKK